MKIQRVAIALTIVNLVLLIFVVAQIHPAVAQGVAPVLRGRALEIVDERGQVRAEMRVLPPVTMPDGKTYAESVLLRMRDPSGLVRVKLDANHDGSGLMLADDSQQPGLHLETKGGAFLEIKNKNGRQQLIKP